MIVGSVIKIYIQIGFSLVWQLLCVMFVKCVNVYKAISFIFYLNISKFYVMLAFTFVNILSQSMARCS